MTHLVFALFFVPLATCMHISGQWRNTDLVTIVAKFGFQQTDISRLEHTSGFIFGNVTSAFGDYIHNNRSIAAPLLDSDQIGKVALVLVTREQFNSFYAAVNGEDVRSPSACARILSNVSAYAFDARCMVNGSMDFLRFVPCPIGQLCSAEDTPANVMPNAQFTYRVQEKFMPGFWYMALVSCIMDDNCKWVRQRHSVTVNYDIWLVNGSPLVNYMNPFEHQVSISCRNISTLQFSFDEQDVFEIYVIAMCVFLSLIFLQRRAVLLYTGNTASMKNVAGREAPLRLLVICLQCASTFLHTLHVSVYAYNGRGIWISHLLADIAYICAINILSLLLIALASGHSILPPPQMSDVNYMQRTYQRYVIAASVMITIHVTLYAVNTMYMDELAEIDVYNTWPGYAILTIRVCYMTVFLFEMRRTVQRCTRRSEDDKAVFLTHFGAAYLVWFIYVPALGVLASQVSALWRFKLILGLVNKGDHPITFLGLTYTCDFTAVCVLVHVFWPRSTNRRFFCDNHRQMRVSIMGTDDLDDYERALITDQDDANADEEVVENIMMTPVHKLNAPNDPN